MGISDFSKINPQLLEDCQHFGTAVHLATQLDDLGTLDVAELSEPLFPYLEAWRKFRKDYNLKFMRDEIEVSLISHKWGFRGILDRISREKNILIDIKSGATVTPAVSIQCAAYAILAEENGMKIKKCFCVQLKEGKYSVIPYTDISDQSIFLSALNCYRFKQKHNLLGG